MAKETGLGARLYVAGRDLSGDAGSLSRIGGGPNALELTGINVSAFERGGGLRDGAMDISTWFNPAAAAAHPTLSALPTTDVIVTYCHRATIGADAACLNAKQVNYDGTRGTDASLSFAVSALANGFGLEWGNLLTAASRTDTEDTAGAGVDFTTAAATEFGLQAYLHVTAIAGGNATMSIEDSDDNGTDPWAAVTGAAFTEVSAAPAFERIQTSRTESVKRWLRVVTTGTFTSVTFIVVAMKNPVSVVF